MAAMNKIMLGWAVKELRRHSLSRAILGLARQTAHKYSLENGC